MEQEQLERCRVWFDGYVAGFYGDDEFINANLKLKEDHSRRTCEETLYLAEELGLSDDQKRVAEAAALFHDVGRFEQLTEYRTYNDIKSVNHCLLGVEVVRKARVLEGVRAEERESIEKAIEYHGIAELPKDLDGDCLLFSKLIRDADKVDVLYVVTEYYKQCAEDPDGFKMELELPDERGYSSEVVEKILSGERIDYSGLRTMNDMKLVQLGWVYDVNFTATLKRIRERGLLEKLLDFLPAGEDVERAKEKVFDYVDSRIRHERRNARK